MANVQKLSVELAPETMAMLDDAELRRLWSEGVASGPSAEGDKVFSRLREKYAKQAERE